MHSNPCVPNLTLASASVLPKGTGTMPIRRLFVFAPFLLLATVTLLAAGCGGSGSPSGVAHLGTSTTAAVATPQNQQASAVAYSQCMRSNGVRGFPDPPTTAADGAAFKGKVVRVAQSNPQRFDRARSACAHLAPQGGLAVQQSPQQRQALLADALSFAHCMRHHGVSRFPDPNGQEQLTLAMVAAQGINVNSPQFLHVVQACIPATHGALTPAKIRQTLNNFNTGHP